MKQNMNKTQILGLAIVVLSLFTYIGGAAGLVGSWLASVDPSGVHIYVRDASTNQHLTEESVVVQITGFSYIGTDYPLSVTLRASKTDPTYWSFSSGLYTSYYVSVSADGYVTLPGTVSMPQNFIQDYTWRLSQTPEPVVEDPIEDPVEEPIAEDPIEDPIVEEPLVEDPDEDPETNTDMNDEVATSLRDTMQTYSLFSGAFGVGLFTLGSIKKEEKQ